MSAVARLKRIALVICLIGLALSIRFIVVLTDRLDPQGESNSICIASPMTPVANGHGMDVTGHLTVCDGMFVHDSGVYIYLHKRDEIEASRSLVFRFFADPYAAPPVIKWINPSQLAISVGSVDAVTKMVHSYQGVEIAYSIGRENYGRGKWQQQVLELKRFIVVITVFAFVPLLLVMWLWFSMRSEKRASTGV